MPRIEPLLHDQLGVSKLAADEIGELRRQAPKLMDMCSRLSDYSVPATLIHGDLHLDNVAISDGGFTFFDWTDACVAHPFMDMFLIFNERDEELRTRLRDTYLELWTDFEPRGRLLELWSLCGVVHALYHAVSYQSILNHTEERSRGELGDALPFLLRKALRYLSDLE
jgi:aminoglycoside phosphotransferase (APT) family kinase protein